MNLIKLYTNLTRTNNLNPICHVICQRFHLPEVPPFPPCLRLLLSDPRETEQREVPCLVGRAREKETRPDSCLFFFANHQFDNDMK